MPSVADRTQGRPGAEMPMNDDHARFMDLGFEPRRSRRPLRSAPLNPFAGRSRTAYSLIVRQAAPSLTNEEPRGDARGRSRLCASTSFWCATRRRALKQPGIWAAKPPVPARVARARIARALVGGRATAARSPARLAAAGVRAARARRGEAAPAVDARARREMMRIVQEQRRAAALQRRRRRARRPLRRGSTVGPPRQVTVPASPG